jgi:hypothetical protein
VLGALDAHATQTTEDWNGRFRAHFDQSEHQVRFTGAALAGLLQQMAAVIRARAFEAQAEVIVRQRARDEAADGDR